MTNSNEISLAEMKTSYAASLTFDTLEVAIKLDLLDDEKDYKIIDIGINTENDFGHNGLLEVISKFIHRFVKTKVVSEGIQTNRKSWSAFYLIKELIDSLDTLLESEYPKEYEMFYRGQNDSWELKPSILREGKGGYSDDFRENFEQIYKNLAYEFPSSLTYLPPDTAEFDERSANLAELQHYGLGTPLVDITSNQFIAMLFMISGFEQLGESEVHQPRFEIFFRRTDGDVQLFQSVKKSTMNKRIDAQRGAFLNFERMSKAMLRGDFKIPRLSIVLTGDNGEYPVDQMTKESEDTVSTAEIRGNLAIRYAIDDFRKKLSSFQYHESDLYPDFDKRLEYIKKKYAGSNYSAKKT
jgi:FRG domain.